MYCDHFCYINPTLNVKCAAVSHNTNICTTELSKKKLNILFMGPVHHNDDYIGQQWIFFYLYQTIIQLKKTI